MKSFTQITSAFAFVGTLVAASSAFAAPADIAQQAYRAYGPDPGFFGPQG